MNARDELAKLLFTTDNGDAEYDEIEWLTAKPEYQDFVYEMADAILAAGYRKPRTITTVEELDALPDDSVVLDELDGPLIKVDAWWHSATDQMRVHDVILPATVLYDPSAA